MIRIADPVTPGLPATSSLSGPRRLAHGIAYVAAVVVASVTLTLLMETILRGSAGEAFGFLTDSTRPAFATIAAIALALIGLDAFTRRQGQSVLVLAPVLLVLAWVGSQKQFYLGDPPYPTDFLYARQIVELMPLMVAERPVAGFLIVAALAAASIALVILWFRSRMLPVTSATGRIVRLALAAPLLVLFATQMDYARHSSLRSALNIEPMMWDQAANYRHNGLVMAFALNVPMANVSPPVGYSFASVDAIQAPAPAAYASPRRPDIIMVMSESLWDPTRLPGVTITPDPLAFTRSMQSGHIFSPEFGGMTANVEFEALTGFSNAFLPYGSIPYQQYVRGEMPSLASFLSQKGYTTLAMHPFQSWFWNRGNVYEAFGFDRFLSEENIEPLAKRGRLASDAALTDLIMKEVDASVEPIFAFAVTLQNHGPYEANRYPDDRITVATDAGEAARGAIGSFSEGMMDSDRSLARLLEWAENRERETIVVFFGDHLPPLGQTYVATGFMERTVSNRFGSAAKLTRERETPLVIWSNRTGPMKQAGTLSPAFLPLHVLQAAGMDHPYYTGFLGTAYDRWHVIDRHLLVDKNGSPTEGWSHAVVDPLLRDYRLIQYDVMFGARHGADRFFPRIEAPLIAQQHGRTAY
ncbi:MAG: LTA synthase family protein [Aquamicrobium sp.]|nr:LTA synthase family protein [Aquamicrobium sp.]